MEECLKAEQFSAVINAKQKGLIQNTLGRMLQKQMFIDEAREKYRKSLEYFQAIKDINSEIFTNSQIGNSFLLENNKDSTFLYYDKCIELLPYLNNYSQKVNIVINLSVAYRIFGEYDKAQLCLEKALTYPLTNSQLARINLNLAKVNINYSEKVWAYLNESLRLAKEEGDLSLLSTIYDFIASYEENRGQYAMALDYHKKRFDYRHEHLELNFSNSMLDMKHKYHVKELQNIATIKQQRFVIWGLVFVLLLITSWIFIYRQKKIIVQAEKDIAHLKNMSVLYNEKEKTLKNIVLKDFNILKKVALLESYMINNESNNRLIKKFNEIVYNQEMMDWNRLYETMDSLYDNLFTKLKENFSQLDETEFRICCLSIAKFSNAEIAVIMKFSTSSVQWRKASIRKKLGIKPMGNIFEFLNSYFQKEIY
ncbi:MAG: hypothetical protein LUF85_05605 [Bacteroides sp.]|nr:hypothetical protein [Bacteroides sp.]